MLTQPDVMILGAAWPLAIWNSVWPYLLMLAGFSLIVFVHELGHFAVAKWADVRVEKFAIGFGRELFGFTRGETRYSFNLLPLGGYVKMLGQEDFDDKTLELRAEGDSRSFLNKPVGHRMAIISAGVIMNILFACFLFMIVFLVGKEAMATKIAVVEPGSPADRAGIQPGDDIRRINGEDIFEFPEVYTAVMLSALHEPLEFVVRRDGELKTFYVQPEYKPTDNTRGSRRQIIGIRPGASREILFVGPEMDPTRADHPHAGDVIVEIDGIEVTDDNVNEVSSMLAYTEGDVIVERSDSKNPDAPPMRVRVTIPPLLEIYPTRKSGVSTVSVLGLEPLVRFYQVHPRGRAYLAGIEVGDTILSWDDLPYPSQREIARAVQDCAERDIPFTVRKRDGRVVSAFVRPKINKRGPATVHALFETVEGASKQEVRARVSSVRRGGVARAAGLEVGDQVLSMMGVEHPTMATVHRTIREQADRPISMIVRRGGVKKFAVALAPRAPGSIDAQYNLIAEDLLTIGGVAKEINGQPTPASQTDLVAGSRITSVNGHSVSRWRELIEAFRGNAGTTVELGFIDPADQTRTTRMPIPHSLRTILDVGPLARIVSIDGNKTVPMKLRSGTMEDISVGYHLGTRKQLKQLVEAGKTNVTVAFRATPLAELETTSVDITEGMIDPWLGRISYRANIDTMPEMKLLKGEGPLDAVRIGLHKTYYFILQVYKIMERMIFTRSVGVENISGPLGIIDMGGKVARSGMIDFIFFMAIISANLAVINFLPLPIVDGGLMVFLIIEKIKGGPVSMKVMVATQMIGLFLIAGAFLFVTFNDVVRLWG